ncbi:hypothetical protein D3C87_1587940 [compost metagenome]
MAKVAPLPLILSHHSGLSGPTLPLSHQLITQDRRDCTPSVIIMTSLRGVCAVFPSPPAPTIGVSAGSATSKKVPSVEVALVRYLPGFARAALTASMSAVGERARAVVAAKR